MSDRDLYYAMKGMLVGSDKNAPEQFHGHTDAYMTTVARPRALEAVAQWEQDNDIPAHHRYGFILPVAS